MTTIKLALLAALCLAILHALTIRVAVMPGVTMPIGTLVLGAEVTAVIVTITILVRVITGQFSQSRSA